MKHPELSPILHGGDPRPLSLRLDVHLEIDDAVSTLRKLHATENPWVAPAAVEVFDQPPAEAACRFTQPRRRLLHPKRLC